MSVVRIDGFVFWIVVTVSRFGTLLKEVKIIQFICIAYVVKIYYVHIVT